MVDCCATCAIFGPLLAILGPLLAATICTTLGESHSAGGYPASRCCQPGGALFCRGCAFCDQQPTRRTLPAVPEGLPGTKVPFLWSSSAALRHADVAPDGHHGAKLPSSTSPHRASQWTQVVANSPAPEPSAAMMHRRWRSPSGHDRSVWPLASYW